jgi:RecA/RadA recombinase
MPPPKKSGRRGNSPNMDTRNLTAQERRELFLAGQSARKDDWRVVQKNSEEDIVPTNILAIDQGLKMYGLARQGTVYHIHGDEGSGKSTTTYALNREYQIATQEPVAIFDFERTTKSYYLRAMGLDEDMAFVKRPDSIEDAVKDFVDLIAQGVRMFTFDSIPRMCNKVDLKDIKSGDAFKVQPGTHARAIKQFYDIVLPYIAGCDGTLLMVNQTRSRIESSMDAKSAAKGYDTVTNLNYTLPGGKVNRFSASAMIELKLLKALKPGKAEDEWWMEADAQNGEDYLCNVVRLRSLKNKVTGTGFRQSMMFIRPGRGLDENISIRQMARSFSLINSHGKRWYAGESMESAIKVYDDRLSAYNDMVLNNNQDVLLPLKKLVIQKSQEDDSAFRLDLDASTAAYFTGEQEHELDAYDTAESAIPVMDDDELD